MISCDKKIISRHPEIISRTFGMIPDARELIPNALEMIPDARELIPNALGMIPDAPGMIPKASLTISQLAALRNGSHSLNFHPLPRRICAVIVHFGRKGRRARRICASSGVFQPLRRLH